MYSTKFDIQCFLYTVTIPKLRELLELKINWEKVGKSLGFAQTVLNQIQDDHKTMRNKSRACQAAMFGKWLNDHPSPTAQNVIVALRKAGESRAAEELSLKYGKYQRQYTLFC